MGRGGRKLLPVLGLEEETHPPVRARNLHVTCTDVHVCARTPHHSEYKQGFMRRVMLL